jgi:hypothetical protein
MQLRDTVAARALDRLSLPPQRQEAAQYCSCQALPSQWYQSFYTRHPLPVYKRDSHYINIRSERL